MMPLCPLCRKRGGQRTGGSDALQVWRCMHCAQEYPVYREYPIHPQAIRDLTDEVVRCPVCDAVRTEKITDAPDMGSMRPFRCQNCSALFPALIADIHDLGPDGCLLAEDEEHYLPVHPQAVMDTVTQLERMPHFFGLTQRLREYIERTNFIIARTEDRVDMESQVREYCFYFVPDTWVHEYPERAGMVQAGLGFSWHAGLAQYAGVPADQITAPLPLALSLSVLINPQQLENSLAAYLGLIQGLSELLSQTDIGAAGTIESELTVVPHTQEAAIQRIAAVRRLTIDLTSPEQWSMLLMTLPQQRDLLLKVWELVSGDAAT
jgi:DNA-directed RNA polymerase subunit RPC12/RpoP